VTKTITETTTMASPSTTSTSTSTTSQTGASTGTSEGTTQSSTVPQSPLVANEFPLGSIMALAALLAGLAVVLMGNRLRGSS
jgi:hypothetical protein